MSWGEVFDGQASTYDDYTADDWHPNGQVAELLGALALEPRQVLDLGAGTGQTALMLRELYPDALLRMVEPSPGMADVARAKLPDVDLVVAYADDHLAADESRYDLVAAVGFLELVPSMHATIEAAVARLAPSGHLAITHEPMVVGSGTQGDAEHLFSDGRTVRRHSREQVAGWEERLGLTRVASRDFAAYHRGDTREPVTYEAVVWRVA